MKITYSKRIISLLLTVLMVVTALPLTGISSFADNYTSTDEEYVSGNWVYYGGYQPGGGFSARIKQYNGTDTYLSIPSQIDGYSVTGIYSIDNKSVKVIDIPSCIKNISAYAFDDCSSLTSIIVNSSNNNYSSENGVLFNKNKTTIMYYPRNKTGISYTIPSSVQSIEGAFRNNNNIETITIQSNVSNISFGSFSDCSKLNAISVNSSNNYFISTDGVLFNKNKTTLICCPSAKQGNNYSIPSTVSKIGSDAFSSCQFTNIIIPDSVSEIGSGAFSKCKNLLTITIPERPTILDSRTFSLCSSLKSVTLYSNIKEIGSVCFLGDKNLTDVFFLGNNTEWGKIVIDNTFNGNDYIKNANIHYCHSVFYNYLLNGGISCSKEKDVVEIGKQIDLSVSATKPDCDFIGWNTDKNAESGLTNLYMSNSDVVLYSIFADNKEYTVNYDANGGTGAPSYQVKKENDAITLSTLKPTKDYAITYNANGGSVSSSSKTVNCTFKNWNTKADGSGTSYSPGATYNNNANVTLYAQWNNPNAGTLLTPTRKGYTFLGWFTSASGGTEVTSTTKITSNKTLYAHWSKKPTLTISDQFSFCNSSSEFRHYNYYITDKDFKKLTDNVKKIYNNDPATYQTVINGLQMQRDSKWEGSCYGMAVATLLDKTNQIGFNENFGNNAKTMHDVQSPRNSAAVESAINYYFLSQFIYPVSSKDAKYYKKGNSDWKAGLRQLSSMVKEDIPMLFCYWAVGEDGEYGHAIVTKGYQEMSDGSLNIITYDNRYPDKDIIVKISSDYNSCVVNGNGNEVAKAVEYTQDMSAFDQIDIDGQNNVYKLNSLNSNAKSSQQAILTINPIGKVTVENANGEKLIIENGNYSGDMEATLSSFNVGGTPDGDGNVSLVFTVPDSDYFMFESDSDEMDISVLSGDIYGHSNTDGANYVVISKKDGISVLGNKFSYDISLSINNSLCDMLAINGNATNDVKLEKKKSSIKATGVDDKAGEVTVYSNVVDIDRYVYLNGYDSFEVVSDGSAEAGNINIMGSSKDNGIYDINIGSSVDDYKDFPDVKEGAWYYDAVKYCAQNGFIGGYSNGKFGPADNLKRQDFVMILARIAGANLDSYANKSSKFSDVKKGSYYYAAVNWAVDNGVIGGYSNGKFGVGDNITREQVATILYRYVGSPNVSSVDSTLSKFSDVKSISAYAKTPIAWAVQNGVISGMADGRVAPVEGASRAQITVIIMRMDEQGMFKN